MNAAYAMHVVDEVRPRKYLLGLYLSLSRPLSVPSSTRCVRASVWSPSVRCPPVSLTYFFVATFCLCRVCRLL